MINQASIPPSNINRDLAGYGSASVAGDGLFYSEYSWCLNIYPSVADSLHRLCVELNRCAIDEVAWRRRERLTNIYLHCCAVADTVDDYLIGAAYDLSYFAGVPLSGLATRAFSAVLDSSRRLRAKRLAAIHNWRRTWNSVLLEFLRSSLIPETLPSADLVQRMQALSRCKLPPDLLTEVAKVPAGYRSHDLSHYDIVALGKEFAASSQDPGQPIVIVGLRTAGSYFAPLLAAYLQTRGFFDIDYLTFRPKKGIAAWERARLAPYAARNARAVVIDEPINTGKTLMQSLELLRRIGFRARLSIVVPVHASRPDWQSGFEWHALSQHHVVALRPERWYKRSVMDADSVAKPLRDWLTNLDIIDITVSSDETSEAANSKLDLLSERKFHDRLKRVHRVDLHHVSGDTITRYILAKGVGWGWYGYHAVLTAQRLSHFLPPVIGLRDGVLFQEWLGGQSAKPESNRPEFVQRASEYVAERARFLKLDTNPVPSLAFDNRHKATDELAAACGKAYGSRPAAVLRRALLREWLTARPCPAPVLIDGKMRPQEWVNVHGRLVKTDFEQHGLGKTELNVVDPAYDLADAILQWRLSEAEEKTLIDAYIMRSGDAGVRTRLHLNKVLAGLWTMMRALDNLSDARLVESGEKFNRSYVDAWTFLIVQTARFTGALCERKPLPHWHGRVVVMDVDGVLDRQIFGFPSTTAAGIRAISLLHAHNYTLAINTARSVAEVQEYCKAYGLAGGVAEYGAYAWDAVTGKEQLLISRESLTQIDILAHCLRQIPGVFLNDDYKYSIRAFTYNDGSSTRLPRPLIENQISRLKLDRLIIHQTLLDTAILARETDKGRGLLALLSLGGQSPETVVAIGDSEPDLPMFRIVGRSYAPAQMHCKNAARLLGCQIASASHQRGLFEVARHIIHEHGHRCQRCEGHDRLLADCKDLFVRLLTIADRAKIPEHLKGMMSRQALASLRQ